MGAGRGRRGAVAVGRTLVTLLSVVVLMLTGYGWTLYHGISTGLVTSDVLAGAAEPEPTGPFTALLVGLDSRTDASGRPLPPALLDQLRAGVDEGQLNTDTIILLHVPAGGQGATAISFPRDSFVPIAGGRGVHKINSAYERALHDAETILTAQGVTGPERERRAQEAGRRSLVATVEDLSGVSIDHYAEINLAGFVEITETLGGVPVCLNAPVREARSGIDLPAGPQTIRGADALAFVRQRRGLDGGDLDRIVRQQAFLAGLTHTALSSGTLADPVRLNRLVQAVTRYVVLDRGWELGRLLEQLRRVSGGDISFRTIPTGAPDLRTPTDGVAVAVDPVQVRRFVQAVVAGQDPSTTRTPSAAGGDVRPVTGPGRSAGPPPSASPSRPADPPTITAAGVPCVN